MFERGILVFIRSPVTNSPIIKSMDEGFSYFKSFGLIIDNRGGEKGLATLGLRTYIRVTLSL